MLATALEHFYTNSSVGRQLAGAAPQPATSKVYQAQELPPAARPFQSNYPPPATNLSRGYQTQDLPPAARQFQGNYPPPPTNMSMVCLWDGCPDLLRNCPDVRLHLDSGHVKRNERNQLVLPNGEMIPREPRGRNLKERALAWHAANPNQLVKDLEDAHEAHYMAVQMGQLLLGVDGPPEAAATYTQPAEVRILAKPPVATPSYQLPLEERARLLQLEAARLAQLKQVGKAHSVANGEPSVGSLAYGLRSAKDAPPAAIEPNVASRSRRTTGPRTRANAVQQPTEEEDEDKDEIPRSLPQAQAKAKEIAARDPPPPEDDPPPLDSLAKESEVLASRQVRDTVENVSSTGATAGGSLSRNANDLCATVLPTCSCLTQHLVF